MNIIYGDIHESF